MFSPEDTLRLQVHELLFDLLVDGTLACPVLLLPVVPATRDQKAD